jgi:rod shape-determining protein MreC
MQQIIYFFQKFKYFLFFLLLEFIALFFTFNNLNFHKSKFVNSANRITGSLNASLSNFSEYIELKSKNELLSEENTKLRNQLEKNRLVSSKDSTITDSTKYRQKYTFTQAKIIARLKGNSRYFGTLKWNSNDYNTVQLHDIPRQAPLKIGDTVETGGKSTIFPEGIPIGRISKINQGNTTNSELEVQLFNDMSNLRYVYIVKNLHKIEIQSLENISNE